MPYIIAIVIIVIAAGALLLFRQPAEAPTAVVEVEEADVQNTTTENEPFIPEGFTPPTTPPPSDEEPVPVTEESPTSEPEPTPEAVSSQSYSTEASYFTPNRTEHNMTITLELDGTTIVDSNISYDGSPAQTPNHRNFDEAYKTVVIGQDINSVELSRVGGASLTTDAFNEAVVDIRAQI